MIDPRSSTPIYRQIADLLRDQIEAGQPEPGQPLPSEGDLAVTYGVGKDAVRDALYLLRDEGLLTTRRGYRALVRQPPPRQTITVRPGDTLIPRRARPDERRQLDLEPGEWVVEINGRAYPAERVKVRVEN